MAFDFNKGTPVKTSGFDFSKGSTISDVIQQNTVMKDKEKSLMDKIAEGNKDFWVGAGKGVASTVSGMSELGQKVLQKTIGKAIGAEEKPVVALPKSITEPTNIMQSAGKTAEQIAEFLVPAGVATKATKAIETATKSAGLVGKGLGLAGKMAVGGSQLAGIEAVQEGAIDKETGKAFAIGAAFPLMGAIVKKVLPPTAQKIETALIKPTQADIKGGYNSKNVFKYDLGGSLEATATKTETKINQLSKQLEGIIQKNKKTEIDIMDVLAQTEKELTQGKYKKFGQNAKIQKAIDYMVEELSIVKPTGKFNLVEAQETKRAVGKLGAWMYGHRDLESNALETVSNTMYTILKKKIEAVSPKEIGAINKALSELIPIEHAIIRRLPVAQRANAVGLQDIVSLIPAATGASQNLWLFFLNRLAKSGNVANLLNKASKVKIPSVIKGAIIQSSKESK